MRNLEVRSPIPAGTNGRDLSKMAMQTDFDCEITGAIRHHCVFESLCIFGEEHLSFIFLWLHEVILSFGQSGFEGMYVGWVGVG